MKLSLHQKLNTLIRQRGMVSYQEVKDICEKGSFGRRYKVSNAERRLRRSESPDIEAVEEGGHITKYLWKGRPIEYREVKVLGLDGSVERVIKIQIN